MELIAVADCTGHAPLAMCCWIQIVVIFAVVQVVVPLIENVTLHDVDNDLKNVETRRKSKKKSRSTSSSSTSKSAESSEDSGESLLLTVSSSSSEESDDYMKENDERKGWRKWHRKCPQCPEEMRTKWRDRSIRWICGGYQRARRSFKSECMMHYRNCQDGTMFVKIHNFRCQNDSKGMLPRGEHFFYDYGTDSQESKDDLESDSSSVHELSESYS